MHRNERLQGPDPASTRRYARGGSACRSSAGSKPDSLKITQTPTGLLARGSGYLNLTALRPAGSHIGTNDQVVGYPLDVFKGKADFNTNYPLYSGAITCLTPPPLPEVDWQATSPGTGDLAGIFDEHWHNYASTDLEVPANYISGSPLSDTAFYPGEVLGSPGLVPGSSYTWSWGTGTDCDTFTIDIGAVPEPSTAALLGMGLFCLLRLGLARKRVVRL